MKASPINALQSRESAHFTEINSLYLHEMTKKFVEKEKEIVEKRSVYPEEVRKTKYARPGYHYIAAHSNYNPSLID
jgi:predicted naringenin-chalcone synthase